MNKVRILVTFVAIGFVTLISKADIKENNIPFKEKNTLNFTNKKENKPQEFKNTLKPEWFGYEILDSTLNEIPFKIVFPKKANKNRDWIWRARFWGHQPQADLALLKQGFHLTYIDVAGLFGSTEAMKRYDELYAFVTKKYHLNAKVVLEGMSRGGLQIFNWGNANAEKIACMYADAPVCDFKSWPGGKGESEGWDKAWDICLKEYGLTEEQALAYKNNPVDQMTNIAKHKVPVLSVIGGTDKVVPVEENTGKLQIRLKELGWEMKVIYKPETGHHPHSLKDPKTIVDFVLRSTGNVKNKIDKEPQWSENNTTLRDGFQNSLLQFEKKKKGHVAFFGGSITQMEGYRPKLYTYLKDRFPETEFNFTNAGIGSTGSTTGAFRFEGDVLSKGALDLLFVEFAVNDDQDAGHSYEEALKGMEGIIRNARKHNPKVNIVMTYFVNPGIRDAYQHGKVRASIQAHMEVAKHYNISSCNLAKEIADQITIGTLNWETFGGTHPADFGNKIAAGMLISMLEEGWEKESAFKILEPIDRYSYAGGKLISPEASNFNRKWTFGIPDWDKIDGQKRDRFVREKLLSTTKKRAKLSFEFNGTAVGAYLLAGPDAGVVEVSIDNGDFTAYNLYHQFSKNLHYPRTVMFATKLEKGKHTLKLRSVSKKPVKGNAVRILNFVVNEKNIINRNKTLNK
jgi:pimeloyl-ACP methyl ester carboxylesterase/lysophospholipase L1-like esterase